MHPLFALIICLHLTNVEGETAAEIYGESILQAARVWSPLPALPTISVEKLALCCNPVS
jgi:hypothetical protein